MKYPERLTVGKGKARQTLVLQKDLFMLEFDPGASEKDIAEILKKHRMKLMETPGPLVEEKRSPRKRRRPTPIQKWVRAEKAEEIEKIVDSKTVLSAAPVYIPEGLGPEAASAPMPDSLLIELAGASTDEVIANLEKTFGIKYDKRMSELLVDLYYFTVDVEKHKAYEIIDNVMEHRGVTYAELDWAIFNGLGLIPNDPELNNQWYLENISAIGGWDLETGSPNIVIAIIDTGCDLQHPDLNYVPVADHFNSVEWVNNDPQPYNADEVMAHGTPVAGIASARIDNGIGVAGVAGGCSIMPVYVNLGSTVQTAQGIRWAADHGAHVINMSFGATTNYTVIRNAVIHAHGQGSVLVSISHNFNLDAVRFPGRYPEVICVGATNRNDERQAPTSANNWGSNYGPELDVMAPGIDLRSTDILGAPGYTVGDYCDFAGTSGAAPQVAGLAALILSRHSLLTNDEVREIIERTCRKVSPDVYNYADTPGRPNGSWHQEMGYGIISVQCALRYSDLYEDMAEVAPPNLHDYRRELLEEKKILEEYFDRQVPEDFFPEGDPMPDFHRYFADDREMMKKLFEIRVEYGMRRLEHRMRLIKTKLEFYEKMMKMMGM